MKAKMGICELVYILQNAVDGLKEKEVHPADINEIKEFVDDLFEYSRD